MRYGVYIARLELDAPHLLGVAHKIRGQRAALHDAGFATKLLTLRGGAVMLDASVLRPVPSGSLARRITHYHHFWHETAKHIGDAEFLYFRFQGVGPGLLGLLSDFRARRPDTPVVLEIPTFPFRKERRGVRQHAIGALDDFCAQHLKRYVDRVVTFSERRELFGIPTIRTQNGVDVASLPIVAAPLATGPLRLVGVANLNVRHAYDRVIVGLASYALRTRQRDVLFEIIGSGAQKPVLEALVSKLGVADMVHFVGPLSGTELDRRLDGAHLGISALGMHRISAETSDLKSREYCARGLSFVTANRDADFPPGMPHVWNVPADDTPIDITSLQDWYRNMSDGRARLRAYAEAHLTWEAKMAPVADWLNSQYSG
jgi:glycosyltransferase involved in cell wall biosynthesis